MTRVDAERRTRYTRRFGMRAEEVPGADDAPVIKRCPSTADQALSFIPHLPIRNTAKMSRLQILLIALLLVAAPLGQAVERVVSWGASLHRA